MTDILAGRRSYKKQTLAGNRRDRRNGSVYTLMRKHADLYMGLMTVAICLFNALLKLVEIKFVQNW